MSENLIEAIQSKCEELRTVYLPAYKSIGPMGIFAVTMIVSAMHEAEGAIASGDTVAMVRSLQELRDFRL